MSNFISLKNKFSSSWNSIEENKKNTDRLIKPIIINQDFTYNKKRQEIILANNQYILGSLYKHSYQFNSLDDKYLQFMHPYAILSTSSANTWRDTWVYYSNFWWESYSNVKILRTAIMGYINITIDGNTSSNLAPIYATIKIKILNPRLFDLLTNSRT